jgi:TIR domain
MLYNPDQIWYTLSTIFHAQGDALAASTLDAARAEILPSGQDFGQDCYRLDLRIPAARFAQLDLMPKQLEKLEDRIRDKLYRLGVDPEGCSLSGVRIVPELVAGPGAVSIALPTQTDEKRIWMPNRVRLFLSHVSRIKTETSALKAALQPYGIDAFVAHEDIEPSQEWQKEIEFALRSMHAFCALVTEDYNRSKWCDQEAGYALGRGVPFVLLACGTAPYGLMGKHQAAKGQLVPSALLQESATRVVDVLSKQESLIHPLTEGAVQALETAHTFASAKASMKRLAVMEKSLSKEQILRMLAAARSNSQVSDATNVPNQIGVIAKRANVTLPPEKVTEDFDDDIPF